MWWGGLPALLSADLEQFFGITLREKSVVEIESEWTGRKRERMGIVPRVKLVSEPVSFGDSS